jgi:hypothetical protein
MCSRSYDGMKNQMMERWFKIDSIDKSFFYLRAQCDFRGIYYNRNSFSEESFIENFPLTVKIKQETPIEDIKQVIDSHSMLNINFTYGLCCNL